MTIVFLQGSSYERGEQFPRVFAGFRKEFTPGQVRVVIVMFFGESSFFIFFSDVAQGCHELQINLFCILMTSLRCNVSSFAQI